VVGCGSGDSGSKSGVDRSKYLDELNAAEVQQLCAWTESILSPGEHTCANGLTTRSYTTSECVASDKDRVHCRVSLTEDCVDSTNGDPCQVLATQACATYIACALGK
jgi:hypothetical protein